MCPPPTHAPLMPPPAHEPASGLPLQAVSAHGRLEGLLFELAVEQRYCNRGERAIEAVFTFPVPSRAVLLGLELQLGERRLEALVSGRRQAMATYEHAIDAGDTAVLLESVGNGLHTVSIGNLLPGETALIRYRHAELLEANLGIVRLQVPTVIAPRYGHPAEAGLHGPAIPGVDVLAEYPFTIEIDLIGIRDDTALESPTHSIRVQQTETMTQVRLAKAARLDRDFVLEVPQVLLPRAALLARDGEQWVAIASAVLEEDAFERRALALTVVLDCSGSMAGDSIEAAKRAVARVLDGLDAQDRIGLLCFGSTPHWRTSGMEPCTPHRLSALRSTVEAIAANLGGTDMAQALSEALRAPAPEGHGSDLLLVTDGQVQQIEQLVGLVAAAGRRLFVVAVGAAPNEGLARRLAEVTGGACDFVAPGELAEAAIVRMARRLRSEPRSVREVQWPATPIWSIPAPTAVFPGETVHLLAGFAERPTGRLTVQVASAGGSLRRVECPLESSQSGTPTLARIAAARRIPTLPQEAAMDLAVAHQIACAFTSFVVVAERSEAEKAVGLPATVAVPQMLAAGWGGAGRVTEQTEHLRFSPRPAAGCRPDSRTGAGFEVGGDSTPFPVPILADRPLTVRQSLMRYEDDALLDLTDALLAPVADLNHRQVLAWLAGHPQEIQIASLAQAGIPQRLLSRLIALQGLWNCSERELLDALIEALIEIVGETSAEAQAIRRSSQAAGAGSAGASPQRPWVQAIQALLMEAAPP